VTKQRQGKKLVPIVYVVKEGESSLRAGLYYERIFKTDREVLKPRSHKKYIRDEADGAGFAADGENRTKQRGYSAGVKSTAGCAIRPLGKGVHS